MAMFANRAGKFRAPAVPTTPGIGDDLPGAAPVGVSDMGGAISMSSPQIEASSPDVKGPSFFGEGGTGRAIAGYIGDFLAKQGGGEAVYAPTMLLRQKDAREDQQRADQFRQQLALLAYKQAHPDPTALEQNANYLAKYGLDGAYRENQANPIQGVPVTQADGSKGIQFIRPGGGGQVSGGGVPAVSDQASYDAIQPGAQYRTPDGHIRIKGGQTQPASGSFR